MVRPSERKAMQTEAQKPNQAKAAVTLFAHASVCVTLLEIHKLEYSRNFLVLCVGVDQLTSFSFLGWHVLLLQVTFEGVAISHIAKTVLLANLTQRWTIISSSQEKEEERVRKHDNDDEQKIGRKKFHHGGVVGRDVNIDANSWMAATIFAQECQQKVEQ